MQQRAAQQRTQNKAALARREPPLVSLIRSPGVQDQIRTALPRHLTPERFVRMALTALRLTPKLADCTQESVLATMFEAAQLGLEPSTPLGQCWIIPYKSEATLVVGYKGFIALADRAGLTITAEVVYEGDQFTPRLGTNPEIIHVPTDDLAKRGDLKAAYAIAQWKDGRRVFKVVRRPEIDQAMKSSAAVRAGKKDSPWFTQPGSMWMKTAVRRLAPFLPLAAEFQRAAALDEAAERGEQHLTLPDSVSIPVDLDGLANKIEDDLHAATTPDTNSKGVPERLAPPSIPPAPARKETAKK